MTNAPREASSSGPPRPLFDAAKVHPAIAEAIATFHRDIIDEVQRAIAAHRVVVVGMKQNPFPRRARKALDRAGIAYHYLEYGSYLNTYRRRLALKMWTGWPTFPMIFVDGTLIGGADDLAKLLAAGELR